MLRINITIPPDLYEQCQKACEKEKISFSHLVRSALLNYIQNDTKNYSKIEEKDVEKIFKQLIGITLVDFEKRIYEIENKINVILNNQDNEISFSLKNKK